MIFLLFFLDPVSDGTGAKEIMPMTIGIGFPVIDCRRLNLIGNFKKGIRNEKTKNCKNI